MSTVEFYKIRDQFSSPARFLKAVFKLMQYQAKGFGISVHSNGAEDDTFFATKKEWISASYIYASKGTTPTKAQGTRGIDCFSQFLVFVSIPYFRKTRPFQIAQNSTSGTAWYDIPFFIDRNGFPWMVARTK